MIDKFLLFEMLFGLTASYLIISIWSSYKVKTLKSYFLADRNLGIFKLTFTLVATQLGSGLLLGTSQRAYQLGLWGILYTIGMSLGFILLGCGFASKMRSLNVSTTAEIFETHYSSKLLKLFASTMSILSLWGILVAQILASKMVFMSIGIDDPYLFILFWLGLICYTMLGGLGSVAIIDTIQVALILAIFTLLFFKSLPVSTGKLFNISLLKKMQGYYFSKKFYLSDLLPTLMMPMLFSLIEQDLAQRFFAAKNRITATISAFSASAILILFSVIPLFFGIFAKIKNIHFAAGSDLLIPTIAKVSSPILLAIAICCIIAAITSTSDSLLSAISSNIVQDFKNFLPMKERRLTVSKIVSFLTGSAALTTSFFIKKDIILVLENSYRLSVICLFIPTVIAYFTTKLHKASAISSIVCGIIGLIYSIYFVNSKIMSDLIPLASSLIGYIITHFVILQRSKCFENKTNEIEQKKFEDKKGDK